MKLKCFNIFLSTFSLVAPVATHLSISGEKAENQVLVSSITIRYFIFQHLRDQSNFHQLLNGFYFINMIAFLKHQNFFHHIILFNFIDNFQTFSDFSKTVCLPSRCGVGPCVMKNWLPLVPGPALAIERIPALSCRRSSVHSSS